MHLTINLLILPPTRAMGEASGACGGFNLQAT